MTGVTTDEHNPYYDVYRSEGEEVSSTNEGRYVKVLESNILGHPAHGDGLVDKGDPVALFDSVGVAMGSATAATDIITIDTEGIWRLSVTNTGLNNFTNIVVGQQLFITSAGVITDDWVSSFAIFGWALQPITGVGTLTIAVKVHYEYPYWYYDPQGAP
jgi:hypothetical protein